jgi:uncharacterized membrane protein YfcA
MILPLVDLFLIGGVAFIAPLIGAVAVVAVVPVIGLAAFLGAFRAKRLAHRIQGKRHLYLLDAVVILSGLLLIYQGVTHHA